MEIIGRMLLISAQKLSRKIFFVANNVTDSESKALYRAIVKSRTGVYYLTI